MYHVTERNERRARTYAFILAVGLHLSLGAVLYSQMSGPSDANAEKEVKVNVAKESSSPTAKAVRMSP